MVMEILSDIHTVFSNGDVTDVTIDDSFLSQIANDNDGIQKNENEINTRLLVKNENKINTKMINVKTNENENEKEYLNENCTGVLHNCITININICSIEQK